MTRTIQVEIDASGRLHPLTPDATLPEGQALLSWETQEPPEPLAISEASLAEDWLRPEEDDAWAHLQRGE